MALDFLLGLTALRFAVNLARFTKTRVCSSCFFISMAATDLGDTGSPES